MLQVYYGQSQSGRSRRGRGARTRSLRYASGARTANLRYDPLGRLYEVSGAAGTTRFLYDGDALVAEYVNGTLTERYVHGPDPGADDPLVWYDGGVVRWLHSDHQGSIVAMTNGSGGLGSINAYDEWGIPNAGNQGRFQYTGQAWLPELGMYHYKARIYSPTLGRFLQTDPIGYEDQVNLYAYVGNDPLNMTDPTGQFTCPQDCVTFRAPQRDGSVLVVRLDTQAARIGPIPVTLPAGSLRLEPQHQTANGAPARLRTEAMQNKLLDLSQDIGRTVNVESGYRTQAQQNALAGRNRNTVASVSPHTVSDAADISVDGMSGRELAKEAHQSGDFERVNLYPTGDVHVDQIDRGPGTQYYENWQRRNQPW